MLTGIIAGLAAQGVSLAEAAVCGVYLHGLAGSLACDDVGLAAGEIASQLSAAKRIIAKDDANVCNSSIKMLK